MTLNGVEIVLTVHLDTPTNIFIEQEHKEFYCQGLCGDV